MFFSWMNAADSCFYICMCAALLEYCDVQL